MPPLGTVIMPLPEFIIYDSDDDMTDIVDDVIEQMAGNRLIGVII